jgi:hypothetical protein
MPPHELSPWKAPHDLTTLAGRSRRVTIGAACTAAVLLGGPRDHGQRRGTAIDSLQACPAPRSAATASSRSRAPTSTTSRGLVRQHPRRPGFLAEAPPRSSSPPPPHAPGRSTSLRASAGRPPAARRRLHLHAAPIISSVRWLRSAPTTAVPAQDGHPRDPRHQLAGATLVLVGDTPSRSRAQGRRARVTAPTDTLLSSRPPNVKSGLGRRLVVTPQGVGTRDNAYGAAATCRRKLYATVRSSTPCTTKLPVVRGSDLGGERRPRVGTGFTG